MINFVKKEAPITFINACVFFLHLLTNKHFPFLNFFDVADDSIWMSSQNIKYQNPKWFKKSFPSLIVKNIF